MSDVQLDERQQRIHRRLALVGRGPAAFFLDACRIMLAPEMYAAPTHLVGHAMREIESSVRDVFEPIVGYAAAAKKQGKEKHAFEISRILDVIGISDSDPVAKSWLEFAGDKNERALHRYAHRLNLDVRAVDASFARSWDAFQMVMDAVLGHLEDRFFVFIDELDRLLVIANPSEHDVQRLQEYVVRNVTTERYFFERLSHLGWLEALREAGVFSSAPSVYWPVSDYVRRMADVAPAQVAICMRETPVSVSFWTVNDYLDASERLDVSAVASWAQKWLLPWITTQSDIGWLLPEKLQALAVRLTISGDNATAFALAEAVLTTDEAKATGRLDQHDFETFLEAVVPSLVSALPDEALRLSLQVFLSAVKLAGPERARFDTIWRPSIEYEHDYGDRLLNMALSRLRDTTFGILTTTPERTSEVVDLLLRSDVNVLQRLALFLLSTFGEHARTHVRSLLLDTSRLRDSFDYGEFGRVLRQGVGLLDSADQAIILSTLEAGPDIDAYVENVRRWRHAEPSQSDIREYVARWRLRFLRQIESVLPSAYQDEYTALLARYGAPRDDDAEGGISVSWGTPSPRSAADLAVLSTPDIVSFLESWTPGEGLESREGLGDALREMVKTEAARFSADAAAFMVEEPVYVSDFLGGIDEAVRAEAEISWEPVLALCEFAASHDPTPAGSRIEATWGWTHQQVAWLIAHAFDRSALPDAAADAIQRVITRLLSLPEPRGPAFQESSKPLAAVSAAMNSVRGVAVDAAVSFAIWRDELRDTARTTAALALLTAVCENEPTESTQAALGSRLLGLWVLNREWLFARMPALFPADEDLWSAAWAGYVFRSRAYPEVFEALLAEYERGVLLLDPEDTREHDELSRRLAQHLAMLYLPGTLPLDARVLRAFFERAVGDIRGTFHWASLRAVADHPEKVTEAHWMRIRQVWDERIAATRRADSQKELHWFGWLVGLLPQSTEWLLRHLRGLVESGIDVGHNHDALSRLAAAAGSFPHETFACVRALADADTRDRHIRGWGTEVEQVLAAAHAAGDPALTQDVEVFINRLAARGVLQFRHILRQG